MNKQRRDKLFEYAYNCPVYSKQYNLFYDYTLFCYLNKIPIKDWINYIQVFLDEYRSNTTNKTRKRYKLYLTSFVEYVAHTENVALKRDKNKLVIPVSEQQRMLKNKFNKLCGDEI